jgi:hypothetical protein
MAFTVTRRIATNIGDEQLRADRENISGDAMSRIDTTVDEDIGVDTDFDIPIYAENDAANKIKYIFFKASGALDLKKIQLLDSSNAVQFDIYEAAGKSGSDRVTSETFEFPGTANFTADSGQTITTTGNDIVKLRIQQDDSGILIGSSTIELLIVFDVENDPNNSSDTIS